MNTIEPWIPYLSHPLVLAGFFLFLATGFCKYLIEKGIIPTVTKKDGSKIIQQIIRYGFIIGLILVVGGLMFKFWSSEDKVNERRINEMDREIVARVKTLESSVIDLDAAILTLGNDSTNRLEGFDHAIFTGLGAISSNRSLAGLPLAGEIVTSDADIARGLHGDLSDAFKDLDMVTLTAQRWRLASPPDVPLRASSRQLLDLLTFFKVLVDMGPRTFTEWSLAAAVSDANKVRFLKQEAGKYLTELRNVFALIVNDPMIQPITNGKLQKSDGASYITKSAADYSAKLNEKTENTVERRERRFDPTKVNTNALAGRTGRSN